MQKKLTIRDILRELIERTNSIMRRIRILEQTSTTLTSRINTLESSALEHDKELSDKISKIETRVREESELIIKLETTVRGLTTKIRQAASMTSIKKLESLIDIYNPLKSEFVTKDEVLKLIEKTKSKLIKE